MQKVKKWEKPEKPEKREAILRAALELIAERGFRQTPMSLIAKQAGASAGIIYHYFESKDELIRELYRFVKTDLSRAILAVDKQDEPFPQRFLTLWLSTFHYCVSHPYETAFLEQYETSAEWLADEPPFFEELADLMRILEYAQSEHLIKDLPTSVITELMMGVVFRFARLASAGSLVLDDETLKATAQACWDAVAR